MDEERLVQYSKGLFRVLTLLKIGVVFGTVYRQLSVV